MVRESEMTDGPLEELAFDLTRVHWDLRYFLTLP